MTYCTISSTENLTFYDTQNVNKQNNTKNTTQGRLQHSIHASRICQILHSAEKKKKVLELVLNCAYERPINIS
jgi:hypothetical protein